MSLLESVYVQHPQTEKQYLKFGSIVLMYKFFKLDDYQSEYKDILFLLHFEYLCHVFSSLIRLIPSDALDEIRYSWKQF